MRLRNKTAITFGQIMALVINCQEKKNGLMGKKAQDALKNIATWSTMIP